MTKLAIGDRIEVNQASPHWADPHWDLAEITSCDSTNIVVRLVVGRFFTPLGTMTIARILENIEWRRLM